MIQIQTHLNQEKTQEKVKTINFKLLVNFKDQEENQKNKPIIHNKRH